MTDVFFRGTGYWVFVDGHPEDPDVEQITSNAKVTGIFKLNYGDEMSYRHTQRLEGISNLYPSTHPDSAFSRLRKDGFNDNNCSFNIDTKKPMVLEIAKPAQNQPKTELKETERQTMLKLILGMAIGAYNYDPEATKNSATGSNSGSIKAGLQRAGLDADQKTINKYLEEAAAQYPDAKPRKT